MEGKESLTTVGCQLDGPLGVECLRSAMTHQPVEQAAEASGEILKSQNRVLELVARGSPLAETLDVFLRAIEAHTPGMLSSILLLDPDGVHVRHGAAPSLPQSYVKAVDGEPIGPQAGSCGTAAYRREAVIVDDIATDPLWAGYRDLALAHGLRACWSTPIFDGRDRVIGTFALYFRTPGRPSGQYRALIDATTYTASIAIVAYQERQAARRREVQFEEAQRIAHLGSYDWDVRSNTAYRSAELCRIFGLRPEEFAPTVEAYLERVHPDDRGATRDIIERSAREHTPFEFEERIVRPDGTVRQLRSQGSWITDDTGEAFRLVGICQDITERKRAEQQQRRNEQLQLRNEELKAFTYMVSHDLKAPLRGIAGYARELARQHQDSLSDRGARCVDEIVAGTVSLDRLIEDLLHYSQLAAETPTQADVNLVRMVDGILAERQPSIRAHHATVSVELLVTHIRAWERGVMQMLTNLIDNAIKFSRDATTPRVRISSADRHDTVRLAVADNGIGFEIADHDRIFGLFNRLVDRERFEGTGAGLAIVAKIAEKIGARVWAESSPGAGATFFLDLPKV